jgi:hypothetical protein
MSEFNKLKNKGVHTVGFTALNTGYQIYDASQGEFNGIRNNEDVVAPALANIIVTFGPPHEKYEVGLLMGIRQKEGWARQIEYLGSYSNVPFLGLESNLDSIDLSTPIFSPILNPYLALYQTHQEALARLERSIGLTLNGLLENGDPQWLKEAIALKKWQSENY